MPKGSTRNQKCSKCGAKLKDCPGHNFNTTIMIGIIVILSIIFIVIINNESDSNKIKGLSNLTDEEQARSLQQEWLEAVRVIVEQTNDQTARQIYEFIVDNGILGRPHPQGVVLYKDSTKKKNWFCFMPLLDSVKNMSELKQFFIDNAAGYFDPNNRAIIMRENPPVSNIWRGLVILHEGHHARDYITKSYNFLAPQVICAKELEAHIFQNKITKKIGGALYQQCIQRELQRIKDTIVIKDGVIQKFTKIAGYDLHLDKIFGPSLSRYEKSLRQTNVWLAAMFDFLDKNVPNPTKAKEHLLYDIYIDSGILQQ